MSHRKAAKTHVPLASFQQRYQIGRPNIGRKPVFAKEQEANICANIKTLANVYYAVTSLQLRKLVFQYDERLQIEHKFNMDSELAGKDWLEGLLKRYSSLSVRKPETE